MLNVFQYVIDRLLSTQVNRDILWSRIQSRLQREPERVKYNENNRAWMEE